MNYPMESSRLPDEESEIARTILILHNFEEVLRLSQDLCIIVPLKGLSLLLDLYKENYDRRLSDIDLLVYPKDKAQQLAMRLKSIGYQYNERQINHKVIQYKHKCTLFSTSSKRVDIDIHTDFITKKYFSSFCGSFSRDCLERCTPELFHGYSINKMEKIDEWLLLAQHWCFHLFSGEKWGKDLWVLQQSWNSDDFKCLHQRASQYNMARIVRATTYHLSRIYAPAHDRTTDIKKDRFITFVIHNSRVFKHERNWDRFIAAFWEFIFIEKRNNRIKAYLSLLFPPLGMIQCIYKIFNPFAILLYPFHLLFIIGCYFILGVYYLYSSSTVK